jgi:hypothetical protein
MSPSLTGYSRQRVVDFLALGKMQNSCPGCPIDLLFGEVIDGKARFLRQILSGESAAFGYITAVGTT